MTKLPFTLLGALLALQLGVGAPASAAEPSVSGEVTKIDESAGKITIRYGAIKNPDMEPMTLVFSVKDPAMLKEVKPGDKIKFEAEVTNGAITVTEMKLAK